jgi:hypothetical protein
MLYKEKNYIFTAISSEIVQEFFTNFADVAKDIPPSNIFNFDETNLQAVLRIRTFYS